MKFLIIVCLILIGISIGITTEAARFDWSLGEPEIVDDSVNTTYYCWSLGEPTICYQFQEEAPPPSASHENLKIKGGKVQLKGGKIQLK